MHRLAAFERMLESIQQQSIYEKQQMEILKAEGKEKSAAYHQYFGNRMMLKMMLDKYREFGLIQ